MIRKIKYEILNHLFKIFELYQKKKQNLNSKNIASQLKKRGDGFAVVKIIDFLILNI